VSIPSSCYESGLIASFATVSPCRSIIFGAGRDAGAYHVGKGAAVGADLCVRPGQTFLVSRNRYEKGKGMLSHE
jgi:hypothetical protein